MFAHLVNLARRLRLRRLYFPARELVGSLAEVGFVILRVMLQLDYGAIVCVATKRPALVAER